MGAVIGILACIFVVLNSIGGLILIIPLLEEEYFNYKITDIIAPQRFIYDWLSSDYKKSGIILVEILFTIIFFPLNIVLFIISFFSAIGILFIKLFNKIFKKKEDNN